MLSAEEEQLEVRSTCSGSTSRCRSSLAKAAVEARAKAEAARARAEFTRREIEVKMRQAELSATLEALKEEKEAEAALAEASVFEAAIAEEVNGEMWSSRVSEKQYGESRQGQENSQPVLNSHALCQLPASTQSYRLQSYLGYSTHDNHYTRFVKSRPPVAVHKTEMNMEDPNDSFPEEVAAVKEDLKNNDTAAAAAKIQEYLDKQNNVPLNIAITGASGAGKSTFVNTLRGLSDDDEGAAPTGVTECTMEVKEYSHPNYPNVKFWDLPGVGTPNFPSDTYLERVGFEKFDFFIIISANRFTENDMNLAKEIQKMEKKFYFVRSKIDSDINAERRKKDFSEEKTLQKIKENCIESLQGQSIQSPQVFLVSSFELHLYDFSLLHETLERELPAHKRDALLFAMPNINLEIINKKKEAFQSKIKYWATLSAAAAGVPVPGLSICIDLSMMVNVAIDYVVGFGLDKRSLQKLSASSGVPYTELLNVLKSPLAAVKITKELLLKLLSQMTSTGALMALEEGSRWIPLIGIPLAMGISFTTTYSALNYFLSGLADDAQRVFKRALGLNTSV